MGQYAGQEKYWPWFWLIVPVYVLVTPLAFLVAAVFDHKALKEDVKTLTNRLLHKRILSAIEK